MIVLEQITRGNLQTFKAIRLRALRHDPSAFGSTYAGESQFTEDEWVVRLRRWDGEHGIGYLAIEDGAARGLAGCILEDGDPAKATLVSMWIAPEHRQRGIGRVLLEAVTAWAHEHGARTLRLMVVAINHRAIDFYQRLGFVQTGYSEPYPNDPAVMEYEMARAI